jgi:hypothetical protein
MKNPPFKQFLLELAAADNSDHWFSETDIAHLKRWRDDVKADKIYKKIFDGKFDSAYALVLITVTLQSRHLAERGDNIQAKWAALARKARKRAPQARKIARKELENSEITPDTFKSYMLHINRLASMAKFLDLDRVLTVRSDKKGSRRRTLFCRLLSNKIHSISGQWHDTEVAELCEIAFDCGDVTDEMVRAARRDFTRKKR